MNADGAGFRAVLDQLCGGIDVQVAPSVTTVLLMDDGGKYLRHGGGLGASREWISNGAATQLGGFFKDARLENQASENQRIPF